VSESGQAEIQALVEERRLARERRDYKRADEIRNQLRAMGVYIQDRGKETRVFNAPGYREARKMGRKP